MLHCLPCCAANRSRSPGSSTTRRTAATSPASSSAEPRPHRPRSIPRARRRAPPRWVSRASGPPPRQAPPLGRTRRQVHPRLRVQLRLDRLRLHPRAARPVAEAAPRDLGLQLRSVIALTRDVQVAASGIASTASSSNSIRLDFFFPGARSNRQLRRLLLTWAGPLLLEPAPHSESAAPPPAAPPSAVTFGFPTLLRWSAAKSRCRQSEFPRRRLLSMADWPTRRVGSVDTAWAPPAAERAASEVRGPPRDLCAPRSWLAPCRPRRTGAPVAVDDGGTCSTWCSSVRPGSCSKCSSSALPIDDLTEQVRARRRPAVYLQSRSVSNRTLGHRSGPPHGTALHWPADVA